MQSGNCSLLGKFQTERPAVANENSSLHSQENNCLQALCTKFPVNLGKGTCVENKHVTQCDIAQGIWFENCISADSCLCCIVPFRGDMKMI